MSSMSQDRSSRWTDIQKGLQFIQSTLPFPGTQEEYEVFLRDLVWKLFGEGNDIYSEGEWARSVELYTEALSIAEYADSEDISISNTVLEKLHANRAAAYLNMGVHDQALEDCDKALQLNEGNHRALYRKARSLKELERHKEAYEAVAQCSLAVPQDPSVIKLTQELAKMLGLKIRKAYVRSKPALNVLQGSGSSGASSDKCCQGSESVEDIEMAPQPTQEMGGAPPGPGPAPRPLAGEKPECESAPVSAMSSVSPIEVHNPEKPPMPVAAPLTVPVATPMATPPLVNGARANESYPVPESRLDYDTEIIGDDLDELLDRAGPAEPPMAVPALKGPVPLPASIPSSSPTALHMPSLHTSHSFIPVPPVNLPPLYHQAGYSALGLDSYSSPLDSLDSLSISESEAVYGQASFMPVVGVGDGAQGPPVGMGFIVSEGVDLAKNPLADTHEFKQACSGCFIKTGTGLLDYTLYADDHKCKKDILLGRIKLSEDRQAKGNNQYDTKYHYVEQYYICRLVYCGEVCRYHGHCTFAYCQEEIDVWTRERKGVICRDLLFDPFGANGKVNLTVPKILQENHGMFEFLCGECFDHKPRIISKRNKESPTLCSHSVSKHNFEDSKCLVHVLRDTTLRYSKIRAYLPLQCQLDLCRHEVRYGCVREDNCFYAHSLIELKVWMMQHELGITHESIVLESRKYWSAVASSQGVEPAPSVVKKFGPPNLKMQFVCGQCWRNGQVSEPDKNRKYCNAKARHPWAKDRRVLLVSSLERKKWTTIRPLPTKKPIPSQFEVSLKPIHILFEVHFPIHTQFGMCAVCYLLYTI
ncbi:zinc finger CCCH domain-containing protein 7A [Anguilla rostrata]|uniref:zinc finger CCCH domain-containing protein 7A n=1 Tax=Anguilla rostrata TaxID=7938 RepID=UPI0030D2A05A